MQVVMWVPEEERVWACQMWSMPPLEVLLCEQAYGSCLGTGLGILPLEEWAGCHR